MSEGMTKQQLHERLIEVASNSICQKRKVGSIIAYDIATDDGVIYYELAFGYNHHSEGRHTRKCEDTNGQTLEGVIHAEVDCLNDYKAVPNSVRCRRGASLPQMYVTHEPCIGCQAAIKQAGLKYTVVKHTEEQRKTMAGPVDNITELSKTLQERGSAYGTFAGNARCTQSIMHVLQETAEAACRELSDWELEALHMIAHKMSRICNGQKMKKDNWHDIAGYAKLAEDLTKDS